MKKPILSLIFSIATTLLFAQPNHEQFYAKTRLYNCRGHQVLGGWAIANMATGAIGWSNTTGSSMYFHQMNFLWNTVNLGVAGVGLYRDKQLNPFMLKSRDMMEAHLQYEKRYLIHTGVDLAFVGTGFLLKSLSNGNVDRPEMLAGYGNSIMMQGGFLFLLDGIMYVVQHRHKAKFLENMNLTMLPDGAMLQLSMHISR